MALSYVISSLGYFPMLWTRMHQWRIWLDLLTYSHTLPCPSRLKLTRNSFKYKAWLVILWLMLIWRIPENLFGGGSTYTSAKFYKYIFEALPEDVVLKAIWKSKCLPKLRVFAWLLFLDRLNTKDLMQRKNWQIEGGPHCVLCNLSQLETRDHLFFGCPFASSCWGAVGINWDTTLWPSIRFARAHNAFNKPCFMEIVVCAAWNIWKERNGLIFNNQAPSLARWMVRFKSDVMVHQYRVKAALVQPLLDWVRSLL